MHLISVCPDYVCSGIMLAGSTLLRLLKSDFAQYLDTKDGKTFLLDCVNSLKLMSCANNDLPARLSQMLAQLWTSDRIFKSPDGSPCLTLRIRSRLAISLMLDVVWWWREEFGGQPGVYSRRESSSTRKSYTNLLHIRSSTKNPSSLKSACTHSKHVRKSLWGGGAHTPSLS